MERRDKTERRQWRNRPTYPFVDSEGVLVIKNRRRLIDRRVSSFTKEATNRAPVSDNVATNERMAGSAEPQGPSEQKMHFMFNGQDFSLGTHNPVLKAGRAMDCEIWINEKNASREHAQLQFRDGKFYLIDQSTNGSYIQPEGGDSRHIKNKEVLLEGRGIISLGRPPEKCKEESLIHFDCP